MKPLTKPQLWLLGISLGALIAILVVPQTGWIVRLEVRTLLSPNISTMWSVNHTAEARSHPGDYQYQLVEVEEKNSSPQALSAAFYNLEQRFPGNTSAYATALRQECKSLTGIEWQEPERSMFSLAGGASAALPPLSAQTEPAIKEFIRQAQSGEAIDPDNAYFPWMLAAGYFANHQDDLAVSSIVQAGRDSSWNEYISDDVNGRLREVHNYFGGQNGISTVAIQASELYPQLAVLRSAARMAIWHAALDEENGDYAYGAKIRLATLHCGALMRTDSTTVIGNLVGAACENMAVLHPGGAPSLTDINQSRADRSASQEAAYISYLNEHNMPRQSAWISKELATTAVFHDSVTRYLHYSDFLMTWVIIDGAWLAAVTAISCWLLLYGLILLLIASIKETLKLVRGDTESQWSYLWPLLTVLALALVVYVINIASHAPDASVSISAPGRDLELFIITVIPVGPFVIYGVIVAVTALAKKRNIGEAILTSMFKVAVPCVLLLLYCTSVVGLARQDAIINHAFGTELQIGEGQYLAQRSGIPWPGMPPELPFQH